MLVLNSKKFPNLTYEPGGEIWVSPEDGKTPFYFDVTEDLTQNATAMQLVASFLDDIENLKKKALLRVQTELLNDKSEHHNTVKFFLSFHRDEFDEDTLKALLGMQNTHNISLETMVACLQVNRFGSFIGGTLNEQAFIMDLSFNPEYSDELLVIYFNMHKDIFSISHES